MRVVRGMQEAGRRTHTTRMMVMLANNSNPIVHYFAGRFPGKIGWLVGPSARKKTSLKRWIPYALDNDAYSAFSNRTEWSESEWVALLEWARMAVKKPLWVLVPDVVANREATLENWKRYAPMVREARGFAVQDGMTPDDVPSDADLIFVGGTTSWKWRTLPMWAKCGKRIHVGRVNTLRRLWTCDEFGVESCDGTGWFREGDGDRIADLETWLEGHRPQNLELDLVANDKLTDAGGNPAKETR